MKLARDIALRIITAVIVIEAILFFIAAAAPDTPLGGWLARNEPLFQLLMKSDLKSENPTTAVKPADELNATAEPVPTPVPVRKVRTVKSQPAEQYIVLGPNLHIFADADIGAKIIGKTHKEQRLVIQEERDGWYLLQFDDMKGWIHPFVSTQFADGEEVGLSHGTEYEPPLSKSINTGKEPLATKESTKARRLESLREILPTLRDDELEALPYAFDFDYLSKAVSLLGDSYKKRAAGDFIFLFLHKDDAWIGRAGTIVRSLEFTYKRVMADIWPEDRFAPKVLVMVMPNIDSFYDLDPDARDEGFTSTAGRYSGTLLSIRPNISKESMEHTLVHEAVHHYNFTVLGISDFQHIPWLDEGLATYMGKSIIDSQGAIRPGIYSTDPRLNTNFARAISFRRSDGGIFKLNQLMNSEEGLGLKNLFAMDDKAFYSGDRLKKYILSWLVIHYFLHADEGRNRDQLFTYMRELRSDFVSEQKFELIIGRTIETLEYDIRAYYR